MIPSNGVRAYFCLAVSICGCRLFEWTKTIKASPAKVRRIFLKRASRRFNFPAVAKESTALEKDLRSTP
jgi:hypothetical protein